LPPLFGLELPGLMLAIGNSRMCAKTGNLRSTALGLCMFAVVFAASSGLAASLRITEPGPGELVKQRVRWSAEVSPDAKVTRVTFKLDGANYTSPLTGPHYSTLLDTTGLLNGVHTLLAVGLGNGTNVLRSKLVQITVTNSPRYALADSPFKLEALGSLISANTQERQMMFRSGPSNDLHLLMCYDVPESWQHPFQLLDADLSSASARLTDGVFGRPGPNAASLYQDRIYLGSSDPGHFMMYNPQNGKTQHIAPLSQKGAQRTQVGDDGFIYIGECCLGGVERYNPTNGIFENLGRMDDEGPAYQYAYTLGTDTRYLYVGLGELPWYLAVYDTQARTKTNFWKDQRDLGGTVLRARTGGWYYDRYTSAKKHIWYALANGAPVEIAPSSVPAAYPWYEHDGVVNEAENFPSKFGVEVELADAYPDNAKNRSTIRWRKVGTDEWQTVDVSGFRLQPVNIKRLYPWEGTKLIGFADFYGPIFSYDLSTSNAAILGRTQFSLYDGLLEKGNIYFSGYPASTLQYDPSKPWALRRSTRTTSGPLANPHQLPIGFGKYHYYSAFGADGFVYVAGHHERDSTGGELGWCDPLTGARGSLREPFLTDDVRDLKPALGASKLVYVSTKEKLFVFDVESKQVERTIVPIPGIGALDKVTEVAPGIIFGAASNRIYKVDIRTGSLLYSNALPGLALGGSALPAYDRRLVLGPDGQVWMFISNSLYRIDPTDSSLTKILDAPAGNLLFHGGDIYVYCGPNLFRIKHVLRPG
jgi:hypothetical protein